MRRSALRGLRKYQEAARPAPPPMPPIFAAAGNSRLLRFNSAASNRAPVVFVPSLINPPRVLDLSPERSLVRAMAAAGHDAYLVDWGTPLDDDKGMDLTAHVADRLAPMIAALPQPPILVGYCLGGTLVAGAAALSPPRALATIATPWHFDGFPEQERADIVALWTRSQGTCVQMGYVPMEVLQSGFWSLDPARTIRKYAAFLDMPPGSDKELAFLAVEDWANEGPPLTLAAGQQLFEQFYGANQTGEKRWRIDGRVVDPEALACPTLSIASLTDKIVPAAASPRLAEHRELALGHVGMIVGSQAPHDVWMILSDWLSTHGG
ncbi:polyhydroxyalkanoate synthase [Sphingobium fontiphilum]|uniref:Polyhydroxyalkanoate synthase n=1 Tax=Sphingobium fontiphilum TaxID=944425 RepID=A0A7W6DCK5_9SPHN|nr:polyhydroxyalkanoate synthase [Sphingobium fontiphilum]